MLLKNTSVQLAGLQPCSKLLASCSVQVHDCTPACLQQQLLGACTAFAVALAAVDYLQNFQYCWCKLPDRIALTS